MTKGALAPPCERRLVLAVVDVVSFHRLCRHKADSEMFEMLDLVYRLIDRVVVAAGGRVVKYMGDAALVVFPEDCARAAVAALQTLKTQTAGLWADFGIECTVRTKAHLGPVACGPLGPEGRFDVIGGAVNELFVMPWGGSEVSADLQAAIPRT